MLGVALLILHEGDERRDDDDGFGQKKRGQLEGEAFAGAGGHDGHRVAALENGLKHIALGRAEVLDTKMPFCLTTQFVPGNVRILHCGRCQQCALGIQLARAFLHGSLGGEGVGWNTLRWRGGGTLF